MRSSLGAHELPAPVPGLPGRGGRARLAVVLGLVLALLAVAAPPAEADPAAEDFRRDIERLKAEQRSVRAEQDRIEEEQSEVRALQRRLDAELQEATDRLAELEAELAVLLDDAATTAREVAQLSEAHRRQRERLGGRARTLYQLGGVDPMMMILSGSSTAEVVDSAHFVAALSNKDATTIEAYDASGTRLNRRQVDLADDREEVTELTEQVEAARQQLSRKMDEAVAAEERLVGLQKEAAANLARLEREERDRRAQEQARLAEIERRRREEEARRRAAEAAAREKAAQEKAAQEKAAKERAAQQRASAQSAAAAPSSRSSRSSGGGSGGGGPVPSRGGMACPQAQPRSFTNDWGNPRSGGRSHQGTDIFGRYGGNVYAITSGTIQFTKVGGRSGLFLSLRGDDGHAYWYMHLSSFAARPGQRVSAGQLIAYNGDSGNAKGTTPHIHFEYHPGGGGPVNPYPLLRSVCG